MNSKVILLVAVAVVGLASTSQAQVFRGHFLQARRHAPVYELQTFRTYGPCLGRRFSPINSQQQTRHSQCQNQETDGQRQFRANRNQQINNSQLARLISQSEIIDSNANKADQPTVGQPSSIFEPSISPASAELEQLQMIEDLIVDPGIATRAERWTHFYAGKPNATDDNSVLEIKN